MNPRRRVFDLRRKRYMGFPLPEADGSSRARAEGAKPAAGHEGHKHHAHHPAPAAGHGDEYEKLKSQFLRLRAEFENYQKRMRRDQENIRKFANEELLKKLIIVVDDVERALEAAKNTDNVNALVEGINIIREHFWQQLTSEGLEKIPTEGQAFDPEVHEAVTAVPSETVAENHVVATLQSGYKLNNRVIRAAMVTVSKKSG